MVKKIAIVGASGRSGGQVVRLLPEFPEFILSAALVSPNSKSLGSVCVSAEQNHGVEVCFTSDIGAAVGSSDAVIDFSLPDSSIAVARACATAAKPILIATTGQSQAVLDEIRALATKTAILLAPNTSIGIYVLHELASLARKLLGASFDVSILDVHHRNKRDAPSGTALSLAKSLSLSLPERFPDADSKVTSLRGGDVPGEHTVFFLGAGERLELIHRVGDRAVFARGALSLLGRLIHKSHGYYQVSDIINE